MPGHVGTSIVENSVRHGANEGEGELNPMMQIASKAFREQAPTSASDAATIILDGVRAEQWRILIGDDAPALDQAFRANPELAYEGKAFAVTFVKAGDAKRK